MCNGYARVAPAFSGRRPRNRCRSKTRGSIPWLMSYPAATAASRRPVLRTVEETAAPTGRAPRRQDPATSLESKRSMPSSSKMPAAGPISFKSAVDCSNFRQLLRHRGIFLEQRTSRRRYASGPRHGWGRESVWRNFLLQSSGCEVHEGAQLGQGLVSAWIVEAQSGHLSCVVLQDQLKASLLDIARDKRADCVQETDAPKGRRGCMTQNRRQ
jgi:hypothetical protein